MLNSRATRLRTIVPLAAVTAAVLLMTFLPASPATGLTGASTSTLPNAGVLRLALGASDTFKFHEPTSSGGYEANPAATQSIGVSTGCRLALSGDALVAFSVAPNNGFAGFVSDGIGVRTPGEGNGQPCGRIDAPGQALTMDLVGTALAGKVIDFAEIDVELKFGATLVVNGYFVEGSTATPMASETYSSTGSDSGPDSGDADNYRVRFPKSGTTAVNQLVFSIETSGGASLEGGADGTAPCDAEDGCTEPSLGQTLAGTTDSLFHLTEVDGFLDCDGPSVTQGGSGTPLTTIERFDNADGSPCVPIPFNQDSKVSDCGLDILQCIFLQKDLFGQQAQFGWTVVWVAEEGQYMEDPTQFDFGNGFVVLEFCDGDTDNDGFPNLPGTDPWCVVNTSTELQVSGPNAGLVVVTETYYGSGDPVGHR